MKLEDLGHIKELNETRGFLISRMRMAEAGTYNIMSTPGNTVIYSSIMNTGSKHVLRLREKIKAQQPMINFILKQAYEEALAELDAELKAFGVTIETDE